MSSRLTWRGDQVRAAIKQRLVPALDEIDLDIASAAKEELYPGHGLRSGTLRRSVHIQPARIEATKIAGAVGSDLVYARVQHDRYLYIRKSVEKVRGRAVATVKRHLRG